MATETRRPARWALPGGLLLGQYLVLSVLVDLPTTGPAAGLIGAMRLAAPVVLAAAAAGWLLARQGVTSSGALAEDPLPAWRPWPALAFQALAFAATAAAAWLVLGPGAPPATAPRLAVLLVGSGATALLALAVAVPLRWAARHLAGAWLVPLLALGLGALAWRAAAAAEQLWGALSSFTFVAVVALLRAGAGQVVADPGALVLGLDGFEVEIAPICSGVNGVGLVLMFLATWIALARRRLHVGRALLLLPLGALAALAANVLRIALLLLVGAAGHEALALGGFHSKLGWILFLGLALGGVALAERLPWLHRAAAPRDDRALVPQAAGAYLGPLMATMVAALGTSLWADGPLDAWYGVRVVAAVAVLVGVRASLPAPRLHLAGALVPALIGAVTCLAWVLAVRGEGDGLAEALGRLSPQAQTIWVASRLLGSILVIPVVEELAFRGFLLPWLVGQDFEATDPRAWTVAAVALSSLAFGVLHASWLAGTAAGLAFAAAKLWRGRLGDAILAHALCNAGVAAAALWGGRLDLWA
ncbi:MAG: exosortase E/protease, VPEID-CTERM system [Anaeromyxobacter sp.]|nr:exosortase E/protease, VPEID-CTERM system [Anaeromyxobacter sp.]